MTRATTELDRNALKTAFKRTLALVGGIDAAASCTRLARSQLFRCGDVAAHDTLVPIDVLLDLERIAGQPLVTAALAAAQGCVLLPMEFGAGDFAHAMQDVAQDAGRIMGDVIRYIAGGMPPTDVPRLRGELADLLRHAQLGMGLLVAAEQADGQAGEPAGVPGLKVVG